MIIQAFPSGPFDTNAYIAACPRTREAAIIDPAPGSANALIAFISDQELTPIAILLTHSHWDHIVDTAQLKTKYKIPVSIHQLDAGNLENPGSDGLPCWIPIEGVKPDGLLEEGSFFDVGDFHFQVIHTPGHTPGGVCFYCPNENILISGDTLFKGTIGNLSFPTARPKLMWNSLNKLAKLPPETRVFPGHGPSTTIGAEGWLARAEQIFGN
jgi:hydroxyacylglutathione hydrolase